MSKQLQPVEKALCLSYLHSKMLIKNLDIALHELRVLQDPRFGKIQFYLEKLNGVARKAYNGLEKNVGDNMEQLEKDIETVMDDNWG